jgi:hypothetical protein
VVARLYVCDTLTDGLDDTSTLVTEDNGESTLGVLSGQCVGIWRTLVCHSMPRIVVSSVCACSRLFKPESGRQEGLLDVPVWQTPV